jgi:hypothetical protein
MTNDTAGTAHVDSPARKAAIHRQSELALGGEKQKSTRPMRAGLAKLGQPRRKK